MRGDAECERIGDLAAVPPLPELERIPFAPGVGDGRRFIKVTEGEEVGAVDAGEVPDGDVDGEHWEASLRAVKGKS
jgi:hypothetical protein